MDCPSPLRWREGEVLWSTYLLENFAWPSIYFSCSSKLHEAGIPPHGMYIEYEGTIEGDSAPILVQYRGGWLVRPLSVAKDVYKFKMDEKEVARMLKGIGKGNGGFTTGVLDKEPREACDIDVNGNGEVPRELKTAVSIAFLLMSALEIRECMHERGLGEQRAYWVTDDRGLATADQTEEELMKFMSEVLKATARVRVITSMTLPPPPQWKRSNVQPERKRIRKEAPNLDEHYAVSGVLPHKQHQSKRPSIKGINADSLATTPFLATTPLTLSEMLAMKRLKVGSAVLEVRHEALTGNRVLMLDLLKDGVAALNGEKDDDLDRILVCVDACYPPPPSSCR